MDLTLVILAAGLSSRYGAPKQLEPVGPSGEALMDYGIYDAVRVGFDRVVLVTRPELEQALREHLVDFFGDSLSLAFAYQELGDVPKGFVVPPTRRKPWGTGHAVLAAEAKVMGPFVAINADDFYGADAYRALAEHLREVSESGGSDFAAAGYTLRDTLSAHGGVSRAVCEVDEAGYLLRVTEVKQIEEVNGTLAGVTLSGERYLLSGDETISMNIWAAVPAAFSLLRERFAHFLEHHIADSDSEFLLSTAVNDLIASKLGRVRVVHASGPWLGVTYREDRSYVVAKLQALVDAGLYPRSLTLP